MKRFLVPLMMVGGLGLCAVSFAPAALAHTQDITPSCTGLSVAMSSYPPSGNHVEVRIDGSTVASDDFGSSYSRTFSWTAADSHVWAVNITSPSPDGTKFFHGEEAPCQPPPTTPTESTPTETTPTETTPTTPPTATTTTTVPPSTATVCCVPPPPTRFDSGVAGPTTTTQDAGLSWHAVGVVGGLMLALSGLVVMVIRRLSN